MTKAMVFKPGLKQGYEVEVTMEDGEPTLDWLYETIGCRTVQLVCLEAGDLWMDEEGKLNGAELNEAASILAFGELFHGDSIVGTAVFFPRSES